jgi:nucleotide-binding universal stress UspA family protein
MRDALPTAGRYHFQEFGEIYAAIARSEGLGPEQIVVGAGSSEVLHTAVDAFTSPARPLITVTPAYEGPIETARALGHPVVLTGLREDYTADVRKLAEEALPYAVAIAGPAKATIHLLQSVPLPTGRSGGAWRAAAAFLSTVQLPRTEDDVDIDRHPVYRESEMASLEAEAKRTLMPAAERLEQQGIAVEVAVVFGRPAGGILRYAQEKKIDLIVMCTHGEGGPDQYAYGPTADRVGRRAIAPVMLVRPAEVSRVLPSPNAVEDQQP